MQTVNREGLLKIHRDLSEKAREVMTTKNQDYASEADVFRNFRDFGALGILVRMSDKLARLRSFEENNSFAVKDEALIDTIVDLLNYAVIYYAYKQDGKETAPAIRPYTDYLIKDGPYCSNCESNLADYEDKRTESETSEFWCSNCAAEEGINTNGMYTLESL